MKELADILQAWSRAQGAGVNCALATVVRVQGSAYRRPGAKMLIAGDGCVTGGVSGGCLERDVIQRAGGVMASGKPALVRYDTSVDPDTGSGFSLGCGGAIDILIEPLDCAEGDKLMREFARNRAGTVTVTTVISRRHFAYPLGTRLSNDEAMLVDGDDLFIDVLNPPLKVLIFGAGTDAVPLTAFGRALGWNITLVDVRSAALDPARTFDADRQVRCDIDQVRDLVAVDQTMAAVVMTHHFNHDRKLLAWLTNQPLMYLGLLGPRHRTQLLLDELTEEPQDLRSPIGLDLGADTPEEVALAIVAEITAVMHGRPGGALCARPGPIHVHSVEAVVDSI